jgi:hypothetical protein
MFGINVFDKLGHATAKQISTALLKAWNRRKVAARHHLAYLSVSERGGACAVISVPDGEHLGSL